MGRNNIYIYILFFKNITKLTGKLTNETPTQVFSCESNSSEHIFSIEHLWWPYLIKD